MPRVQGSDVSIRSDVISPPCFFSVLVIKPVARSHGVSTYGPPQQQQELRRRRLLEQELRQYCPICLLGISTVMHAEARQPYVQHLAEARRRLVEQKLRQYGPLDIRSMDGMVNVLTATHRKNVTARIIEERARTLLSNFRLSKLARKLSGVSR